MPAVLGNCSEGSVHLSYTRLLAATVEQKFGDAGMLWQEAIGMRHNHAQLYLNLAKVYQNSGRLQEAIEVLERGLISASRDSRI
jgi:tetratricopeptide (TPR) repeat protein